MMRCAACGREAFLIRNQCAACNPSLHRERRELREAYTVAESMYRDETGCEPLQDWERFESWLQRGRA